MEKSLFSVFNEALLILCLCLLLFQHRQINKLKDQVAQLEQCCVPDTSIIEVEPVSLKQVVVKDEKPQKTVSKKIEVKEEKQAEKPQVEKTVETTSVQSNEIDKEAKAMEGVKSSLKMYVPDFNYSAMRAVTKNDGTIDVIVDYYKYGETKHTYYNVKVDKSGKYKINSIYGIDGIFPYY